MPVCSTLGSQKGFVQLDLDEIPVVWLGPVATPAIKWELLSLLRVGFGNSFVGKPRKVNTMSAPQTNIEKQKKRHRGPLIGMALVAIFGVGMIFFWLMDEAASTDAPADVPQGLEETVPAQPLPTTNTAP